MSVLRLATVFLLLGCAFAHAEEKSISITAFQIKNFSPRARADLVSAIVSNVELFHSHKINSQRRLVHMMAQFATETGGLQRIDENMNYSAKGLVNTFRARVTQSQAMGLVGNPKAIANHVYGDRLGNFGRHTNDGWDYRGSGYIQLTGRYNFRRRGSELNLPLEKEPEKARKPLEGLQAALAYWTSRNINAAADRNNPREVRILVNGKAAHGYASSVLWLQRAQKAFGTGDEAFSPELDQEIKQATIDLLRLSGTNNESASESGSKGTDEIAGRLKFYQKSNGLTETGKLDEDTLYSLTDPERWKNGITSIEPPKSNNEELEENLETALVYNVNDGTITSLESGTKMVSLLQADLGTGKISSETSLSSGDMDVILQGKSISPDYERRLPDGRLDTSFVPYTVIEPDDREAVINTTEYPERTIAQVSFKKSNGIAYNCSGSMVTKNVLITAGHCVYDKDSDGGWAKDITVYPGRSTDRMPFGKCGVQSILVLKGWISSENSEVRRFYDVAGLKLDCDVGSRTGWLPVAPQADVNVETKTTIRGYPCDKAPAGRMWMSHDFIRESSSKKVFYQNDTYGCMSGAPVFIRGTNEIIAVHTNGLHGDEPWSSNNAGTRITTSIMKQINIWSNAAENQK